MKSPQLDPIQRVSSDPSRVLSSLRKLILDGHYPAGARLAEIPVSEALGVSRTPVRLAFRSLEQEGLLQKTGARGFVVRPFRAEDVLCALEIRGVLEGLAARRLAEQGLAEADRQGLQDCLIAGDQVLAKGHLVEADIAEWGRLNHRFHSIIVNGTGTPVIADALARNNHLPFASADSIVIDLQSLDKEFQKLYLAQVQHRLVVEALVAGESARVEMLMREHAYIALRYAQVLGFPVAAPQPQPLDPIDPR